MFKFRLLAVLLGAMLFPALASATPVTLNFEGLTDGTSVDALYSASGITFTNGVVATSGVSLNEFEFPPHSGQNVVLDGGGPITLTFSNPISSFAAYFTYAEPLQIAAFNALNAQIFSATSSFSQNFTSSGNTPNELIQLSVLSGISSIVITGDPSGGSFVLDDLSFDKQGSPVSQTPEPGSFWLLGTGVLLAVGLKYGSRLRPARMTS